MSNKPAYYKIEVSGSEAPPIECGTQTAMMDHLLRLMVDEGIAWKRIHVYKLLTDVGVGINLRVGDTTASGSWSKP